MIAVANEDVATVMVLLERGVIVSAKNRKVGVVVLAGSNQKAKLEMQFLSIDQTTRI